MRFNDTDLADILKVATENPASAFAPRGASPCMRILEVAAMKRARTQNVCSFNQFRGLLGLPSEIHVHSKIPLLTFETPKRTPILPSGAHLPLLPPLQNLCTGT